MEQKIAFLPYLILILMVTIFSIFQVRSAYKLTNLSYYIVDLPRNAENLIHHLEEANLGPVLWRGSIHVPISNFKTLELQNLYSLKLRNLEGDKRLLPQYHQILKEFQPQDGIGERIFVMGADNYQTFSSVMNNYEGKYFINSSLKLQQLHGMLLWVIITLILFILLDQRRWTLTIMLAFFPGYFIPTPVYIGLLTLLCISLRDFFTEFFLKFNHQMNTKSNMSLPRNLRFWITFIKDQAVRNAKPSMIASIGLSASLIIYSLVFSHVFGLFFIVMLICLTLILVGEMTRITSIIKNRDHKLFFAMHLIPSLLKPSRRENLTLLFVITMIVFLPLRVFPQFSSMNLINSRVLGTLDSATDIESLRIRIIELLDARVLGVESNNTDMTSKKYSVADILLADRAYQQMFPYLGLGSNTGASRYENGRVYLTRYTKSGISLDSYEELVFELTDQWIVSAFRMAEEMDMLRLYTDGEKWYGLSSSTWPLPHSWNILLEILVLFIAGFLWVCGSKRYNNIKITMRQTG